MMKKNKPFKRYYIYVDGYAIKGSFTTRKEAMKMFKIIRDFNQWDIKISLYKGWLEKDEENILLIKEIKRKEVRT